MHECVHFVVFLAQHARMIRIGGDALQSVSQQFLKTGQIVSQRGSGRGDADARRLRQQTVQSGRRTPLGRPFKFFRLLAGAAAGMFIQGLRVLFNRRRFANHGFNAGGVEAHIGHRREQRFDDKYIHFIDFAPNWRALVAYWLMPFAA